MPGTIAERGCYVKCIIAFFVLVENLSLMLSMLCLCCATRTSSGPSAQHRVPASGDDSQRARGHGERGERRNA